MAVTRADWRDFRGDVAGAGSAGAFGSKSDRHAANRRLKTLAKSTGMHMPPIHPHMLRHKFVTTMLYSGVSLRDVQIAARHADPRTTMRYDPRPP